MPLLRVLICLTCFTLLACSNEESKPAKPPESAIVKTVKEPIEKAKAVEQVLQDAAEAQKKAIDQQTQ